ncbi:MAG TPA: hypothetical protein VIW92_11955 [Thermoanaerobaculia bacterium]
MRSHAFAVAFFSVSSLALAQQPPAPAEPPAEQLELTASTPEHVAGTFSRGGTLVRFNAQRTAERGVLELRNAAGHVLVQGTIDKQSFSMSLLDGRLNAKGPTPRDPKTLPPLETSGDPKALAEFKETAEYRLMPYLSRALGERGITGRSHPASLGLHLVGAASATAHKVRLPPLEAKASAGARAEAPSPSHQCFDQQGDPCNDDCFGMCGADCNCWSWVCGDCCVNTNCLLHDTFCSQCQCEKGTDCVKCACFLCYVPLTVLVPSSSPDFLCNWQSNPCPNQAACDCSSLSRCGQIKGTDCGWCVKDPVNPIGTNVARYGSKSGPNQGQCQNWIWDHHDCECASITTCSQIRGTNCGWCTSLQQAMPGSKSGPSYQPAGGSCQNNWIWESSKCP